MNNRVDAEMSPASLETVKQAIATIRAEMPFLIKLSDEERKSLASMDDGRRPFVGKSFDLADRNSFIDPGKGMLESGKKDLLLYEDLDIIKSELVQLTEMVGDTRQMVGAEAYETARFIYSKSQLAVKMKEPGSQSIVDELGKLFKHQPPPPPSGGKNPE